MGVQGVAGAVGGLRAGGGVTEPDLAHLARELAAMRGERTFVCGNAGSGKTTLARAIAAARGVTALGVDALRWGPDWTLAPPETVGARLDPVLAGPSWIVEDGSVRWLARIAARADRVIWLDVPALGCVLRVARRSLARRLHPGRDGSPGCEPAAAVLRHLRFTARYPVDRRPHYLPVLDVHPGLVRIACWAAVRELIDRLQTHAPSSEFGKVRRT